MNKLWCKETRDDKNVCTDHRDWGWSMGHHTLPSSIWDWSIAQSSFCFVRAFESDVKDHSLFSDLLESSCLFPPFKEKVITLSIVVHRGQQAWACVALKLAVTIWLETEFLYLDPCFALSQSESFIILLLGDSSPPMRVYVDHPLFHVNKVEPADCPLFHLIDGYPIYLVKRLKVSVCHEQGSKYIAGAPNLRKYLSCGSWISRMGLSLLTKPSLGLFVVSCQPLSVSLCISLFSSCLHP